ncbi:MAG: S1/P1 nuclease [Bdellovibrionota bacterium]
MKKLIPILFISLWITLPAWGWGELGHRIIAEYGTALANSKALENCRVRPEQIVSHTNDPDKVWKNQRRKYRNESQAHFFHVSRQPKDWRTRKGSADLKEGFLVYRIVEWADAIGPLRKDQEWDEIAQKLYGLSHYVGDLTQPLHLHHDYDGEEAGLPNLHAQFETKMLNRYENEIRSAVRAKLESEKIPALWSKLDLKSLIFNTAEQSYAKTPRLFEQARPALKTSTKAKRSQGRSRENRPRFVKPLLWQGTGELAVDQLVLAARLWAYTLNTVCK